MKCFGYLRLIMVSSASFERDDRIKRLKKNQQLEIKQSEANRALFRTRISNKKIHENAYNFNYCRRKAQKEEEMLTKVYEMFHNEKWTEILAKRSSLRERAIRK